MRSAGSSADISPRAAMLSHQLAAITHWGRILPRRTTYDVKVLHPRTTVFFTILGRRHATAHSSGRSALSNIEAHTALSPAGG